MMKKAFSRQPSAFRLFLIVLLLLLVPIILNTYYISQVNAAETSSPSAELKQKLRALQEEIASKAAALKVEVGKKLQNKAYIGFVKSVSGETLTLALSSSTKIVTVNDYTQYQNLGKTTGKTKFSLKDIAAEDYLVALGDIDDNQLQTAKKIIRLSPHEEEERQIIFGEVTSLGDEMITLQTKLGQNITVSVRKDTAFESKEKGVDFTDLKVNKPVIVGGISSKSSVLKADYIYLLPTGIIFKPKLATTSAKPVTTLSESSSRSATPKVKAKTAN